MGSTPTFQRRYKVRKIEIGFVVTPVLKASSQSTEAPAPRLGRRRIGIVFLAAGGLLVASVVFVYQMGLFKIRAEQTMSRQLLVLQGLGDFLSALKDAE